MKIKDVRTVLLTGPCTFDKYLAEARTLRSAAFIVIETDAGLVGIGETYAGYFIPEVIPEIVDFFKPILLNNDVSDIPNLWQRMYHCGNFWCRVGLGAIVLTGIEAALWDLKGKMEGVPVYKLLQDLWKQEMSGIEPLPFRESIPCYATGGPSNYPLDKLLSKIDYYTGLGFNAVKIGAGKFDKESGFYISSDPIEAAETEEEKVHFIRSKFGNQLGLMIDAHMGNSPSITWGFDTALKVAKALEKYNLLFLEEPLHYNSPNLYRRLCDGVSIPIAGGECLSTYSEWESFIGLGHIDVGQPDASYVSGLTAFIKTAALLAKKGIKIAPHAWGAGGAQMQNIHCGFACTNTLILEVAPAFGPLHSEVIVEGAFEMINGHINPPTTPGLGVDLPATVMERYPFKRGSGEFNSVPGKILNT